MQKILGISGSLRNARFGAGNDNLIEEIKGLRSEGELQTYLGLQTKLRVEDFLDAGRRDGQPFDQIYKNLVKAKGDRGLSNSEAALAAALWGAHQAGAEIAHIGLAAYFPMNGEAINLDDLRARILAADGLLISGPVYFGDRGSLVQALIEFLREDPECAAHVKGKLYAGISVGAKRNGGQETTLIYQMIDLTNLNMLAVGNDSATTAQYGGTGYAGDVGTMHEDSYGIETSISTGRRIAVACQQMERGRGYELRDKLVITICLLQDDGRHNGRDYIRKLAEAVEARNASVAFQILDMTEDSIARCIACDICPTHPGPTEEYRCIIGTKTDGLVKHHRALVASDAFLLAAYSPVDRSDIHSVYQRFVERTRYLRRDDYAIGDRLAAPLVISEINSNQNLHIRMMTSFIRHHQIMHHPLIGFEYGGVILNWETLVSQAEVFAQTAMVAACGMVAAETKDSAAKSYNPIGYSISAEKVRQDQASGRTGEAKGLRRESHVKRQARLKA